MAARQVAITPINPPGAAVIANLVGPAPLTQASGGSEGWQLIARPRRKAATQWYGSHLVQISLPLLLDNGDPSLAFDDTGPSIEPDIATLLSWDLPAAGSPIPPILQLHGPVPGTDLTWVMQSLAFDESSVIRSPTGDRVQAGVKLTLYEFQDLNYTSVASPSPAHVAAANPPAGSPPAALRKYTVRRGDTLSGIAVSVLGDYRKWPLIASINHLRDPNYIQVGQVLVLP